MKSERYASILAVLVLVAAVSLLPATAQIQVNATNPPAAPQGTVNLNVTISGSGFKKGATAAWYVTGTNDTGGVTVNSTTFNGSNKLTANITVASDAAVSGFDVVVTNTNGRTGKGTDAFTVTAQGTPIGCWTTGTPSGATLQATLNPVQPNGAALVYDRYGTQRLGNAIRVRPLNLNGHILLVAFVASGAGSGSIAGTYVFFLDSGTGLPLANNPANGVAWQNPMLLLKGYRNNQARAGDMNGDGIPDFVQAGGLSSPYLFVGSVDNNYNPSWNAIAIAPPASTSVALGDVDGIGADEIVFGGSPSKTPGQCLFTNTLREPSVTYGKSRILRELRGPVSATPLPLATLTARVMIWWLELRREEPTA